MTNGLLRFFAGAADKPEITDKQEIERQYRRNRVRVMLAITLGYGLIYTCRLALGMVKKPLINAGIFTPEDLGLIGSAVFLAYGIGKLTNGFLADHSNVKRFMAAGFLGTAACNLAMGCNTTLWLAIVLWGMNGWFQSFGAPAGVVAMTAWFPTNVRGRIYGIWSTAHSIGEGLTFVVIGAIVASFGWRFGFWGPGMIGVVTSAGVFLLLADRPTTLGLPEVNAWKNNKPRKTAEQNIKSVLALQLSILKLPSIWILCASSATIYVTRYAIDSWGVLYLQESRGYSLTMAGTLLMVNTLAGIVGAIAFGFISDNLFDARRPPTNLLFAILELLGLFLFFFGPNDLPVLTVSMVMFGMGMTGLVTSLGGLFAVDVAPNRVAGAAMGVIGVCSYIAAGIEEQVSGAMIQHGMHLVNGQHKYNFGPVICFWIGSSVLSLLLALSLWGTRATD